MYGSAPAPSDQKVSISVAVRVLRKSTGEFVIGDETRTLGRGQLAWSSPGEVHGVRNASSDRLVLLVAMAPNPNVSG